MTYLVWTGDDFGKVALLFILAFHNGFYDAGMIRAQIHETMRDARLPYGLEEGEGRCVNPAG